MWQFENWLAHHDVLMNDVLMGLTHHDNYELRMI